MKSSAPNPGLTHLSYVRSLLAARDIHPNRVLGQSFLIDRNILDLILATAELEGHDAVLEIGAGLGVVTRELVRLAGRVTAVEKDARLIPILRDMLGDPPGLELLEADALDLDLAGPWVTRFSALVSNLPYSVGGRILAELVQAEAPPSRMVVMVQREVAQRLAAPPGTGERGTLGVWIQLRYDVAIVKRVSRTCFWPPPEIESAIVCLRRHEKSLVKPEHRRQYFDLTKYMFQQRRKQVARILSGHVAAPAAVLAAAGIDPASRPEELSVEAWGRLAEQVAGNEKETRDVHDRVRRRSRT